MKMIRKGGPRALATTAVGEKALRLRPMDMEHSAVRTTITKKIKKRSGFLLRPMLQ